MTSATATPATAGPASQPAASHTLTAADLALFGFRLMLGAGFFAVTGIATQKAGVLMLASWVVAMAVAGCCATSAIRLAAEHASRTYGLTTGRPAHPIVTNPLLTSLGHWAGICAKTAAAGVLALTIHEYMFPDAGIWLAAVLVVAALMMHCFATSNLPNICFKDENNLLQDPAAVLPANIPSVVFNRFIAVFVFLALTFIALAAVSSRQINPGNILDNLNLNWGIVPAAGLLFFALGGYDFATNPDFRIKSAKHARNATIGVVISVPLICLLAFLALLSGTHPDHLADSNSPLIVAADIGGFNRLSGLLRLIATVACLGVLLPLLKSLHRDLAATFAAATITPAQRLVSLCLAGPRATATRTAATRATGLRNLAVLALLAISQMALVLFVGTRSLITFASFCLLLLGASLCLRAWGLPRKPYLPPHQDTLENRIRKSQKLPPRQPGRFQQRRLEASLRLPYRRSQFWAEMLVKAAAALGMAGCLLLAFSLPWFNAVISTAVLGAGTLASWRFLSPNLLAPDPVSWAGTPPEANSAHLLGSPIQPPPPGYPSQASLTNSPSQTPSSPALNSAGHPAPADPSGLSDPALQTHVTSAMPPGTTSAEAFYVRVSGLDQPGVLSGLLETIGACQAQISDIEQITIRKRLTLGLIVELPRASQTNAHHNLFKELLFFGWNHGVQIEFEVVDTEHSKQLPTYAVTLLGAQLTPQALHAATRAIADWGGNISRVVRLSRYPVFSYELHIQGGDLVNMRKQLLSLAAVHPDLDIAFQVEGIIRRAKRLIAMDMDSTLIQDEVIDLLAAEAGRASEVAAITHRTLNGELDFAEALRLRVAYLEGLDAAALSRVWQQLRLAPGARTFLRSLNRLGYQSAIVSGGFSFFADKLAKELDIDHTYANTLEIVDGRLTGKVIEPIADRAGKARFLTELARHENIPLAQTVAIGDGANDLDMLETAGLGIAFCAKPVVRQAADTSLNVPFLDAVLYLLGVSREEVEAADQHDGLAT